MPGVKTAISLDEELLIKVNRLANDLHVSRSKVFTLAVQDYLKIQENQSLLAQLNEAYEDFPSE
ncbi:MAG: ribbon-helix-helix domain-containing protein, partial [Syntrophales bacterium]|nr:ribbon-helix-helix domain-containing protein [Syntrophales bacterium]